jgi:hypothetical protein
MVTGISHSYLYNYPNAQLYSLIVAEIMEMGVMFFLWKKFQVFEEKIGIWARLIMNLIMVGFQGTMLLMSLIDNNKNVIDLIDSNMYTVLIFLFGSSFFFCLLNIVSPIVQRLKNKSLP